MTEYPNLGTSIQKTTYAGENYWYIQHKGWLSNALCSVEEGSCKRLPTVGSHLYDILERIKLQWWRAEPWLSRNGKGGRIWRRKGSTSEFWGAMKLFCTLIVVVVHDSCQNSQDCTILKKVNFTLCELKKVQKFLKRAGGRLSTVETRTQPIKTKSHHCLVNNLEKILLFFSLHSPSLVKGTSQAGVLATCQDSAFAEGLFILS